MNTAPDITTMARSTPNMIKVMIVEDSFIIRRKLREMLEEDPKIQVSDVVSNGFLAIKALERQPVDVILLDIEMPVMDGMTALPKLLEVQKDAKIIIISTLTTRNAEISLKALEAGATDYITKPQSASTLAPQEGFEQFKKEVFAKIHSLSPAPPKAAANIKFGLRPPSNKKPQAIAIGASTGGPTALIHLINGIKDMVDVPVLITQHMPKTFTKILAERISKQCGVECHEAIQGEEISKGHYYLAPGDVHMLIKKDKARPVIELSSAEKENFCRPAVDPMLRSMVSYYNDRMLAIILTGMGQDGLEGGKKLIEAGGTIIAQDQKTSTVWGMPGAVATNNLCSAVLPLNELPDYVQRIVSGGKA